MYTLTHYMHTHTELKTQKAIESIDHAVAKDRLTQYKGSALLWKSKKYGF